MPMRQILLMIVLVSSVRGQTYPRWFLEPGSLHCGLSAVGYSVPFFSNHSSDSVAFADACQRLSIQHFARITGGEAFWATEAGVYWMGSDFKMMTDTSYLYTVLSEGVRLDSCSTGRMTVFLAGERGCDLPVYMRELVRCPRTQPNWVENLPQDDEFIYAEGAAPEYFYESSSWQAAEKHALFNLARSVRLSLESLQKSTGLSGQEIRNEEIAVALRNVQVVRRWADTRRGLFYVLVRMPAPASPKGN